MDDAALVVLPVILAAVRVTVFLVIAPPFNHRAIPATVKAMLGVGLALALASSMTVPVEVTAATLIAMALSEAVTGAGLGVLVSLIFSAVQSAGRLIDMLGGFELGQALDPMTMTNSGPFGRFYQLIAVVLLFVSDGYQLVVGGLARSFDALPLGAMLDLGALAGQLAEGVSQLFLAAIQVAGPLIAVLFLADVGLGLLTRVAPALNAFALGFPLKILITLTLGSVTLAALPGVVDWLADQAIRGIGEVVR
ncbi:flagellar biosynthetic protein FliR [Oceanitalea stevensii]|uniref:Flagellar biosynthetic protein FliR n=1 Tax=Oceanitalea stevensii TaxID=2763072 RepID=A0ABR8Z2Y3_9MICO|nr:flagellar biosynthetic protein FliR [Oceanitalea stevensii]MBD8062693.1 flagellar biosynthetic protein FliR [Oceanitalea stevensii]